MAEAFSSQHTNTFPDFLAQSGISLLVSTYQAGKLIALRHQNGVLNTHFVDMPKPMGIALQEPHLAVGTGFQVSHYYNMPDVGANVEPRNTHDACYLPRETHITGDIDIHEMGFTDDKELWLVNTKMSCLCTLSAEHSVVPRWRPPFISAYDLTDRCHLNGLALKDGKPAYVSALGTTDTPAGWREKKANGGMIMDIRNNQIIASGLSMPHSPRWYQDQLWILESGAGSLAIVDIETGKLTTVVELPGFTRGLDFIGRYAVIGLSQVRETAVFAGLPLTERCQERQCGVYIVDIVEKQVVGFVIFSGDVQEIFSVQILPSSFPAVLSMDDPLLHSSYSLPDEALKDITEPDVEQIDFEKAMILHRQGELEKAISAYLTFLEKYPHKNMARFHLGTAYLDLKQWRNAIDTLEHLIQQEPNHAEALNSLGQAFVGLKDWDKAKYSFDQAIKIDQQYAKAHVNRSLLLLCQGKFNEGWKEYEWRWKLPEMKALDCPQAQWQGEDISNKILLVHTEQTDADIIQFARFLPLLTTRCKKVIVLCSESFRLFFQGVEGVDEVRMPGQIQADSFDVFVPMITLPHILGTTLKTLPVKTPYWHIIPEVVVTHLKNNKQAKKSLKIGLIWKKDLAESNQYQQDSNSLNLDSLLPLAELENTICYSLQTVVEKKKLSYLRKIILLI